MTEWDAPRARSVVSAADVRWVHGVLDVGFMQIHKVRMVRVLNEAQNDRCGICGGPMLRGKGRRKRSLEHVWPQGLGGRDEPGNFVASHISCNNAKADTPPTGCQIIMLIAVCEVLDIPLQLKSDQPPWRLPPPGK